jgi:peptidoglycan-associated lipoprotein
MKGVLMIPTAVLILVASGCAKQPATLPASASAPSPGASTGAASMGRTQPAAASSATAAGGASRATTGRTDSGSGTATRPAPRDFTAVAALKDVNFDFDKYDIRPADAKVLDANAAWLKTNARNLLLIEGHCDERGTPEYNLVLGERRAKAAMSYLVALGIPASRISIISYGEERPLCRESGEACWAKNRRAHFLVKPE